MNLRPIIASIVLSIAFTGCATFSDQELGQIRQQGVSPAIVGKLKDGRVLTPPEVIEMSRRGVADELIIRQIEDAGVDYVLTPSDLKNMEKARVSQAVGEALIKASEEFARRYGPPGHGGPYGDVPPYPYGPGPYYYGGYPYYYPYGGVGVVVGGGRYWGGGGGRWH